MPLEVYSENVWICSTLLSCEVSQATNVYLYTCSDFLNHITSHWHHCHGHIKVVENIITIQVNPSEQLFSIMWEASKRIPKTHQNSDSWVLNGWKQQDMKKWFEKWDASHMLHDMLIDYFMNVFVFCNANVSQLGKYMEFHVSHIILQMLCQNSKPFFFFQQGNYSHQYMLVESIFSHTYITNVAPNFKTIFFFQLGN